MNFLKKLFQKKEEIKDISFNELSSWLVNNIEFSLDKELNEFKLAKFSLEEAMSQLSKAKTKDNAKRIENAVKTNKKTYITALKSFLNKIDEPKKLDYESLTNYTKEFDDKLKNLNKRTIRNYHIIKTLVGQELEEIRKALQHLDSSVKKISETLEKHNLKEIEEIHLKIKEINDNVIKNKEVDEKHHKLNKEKETLDQKEKSINQKIETLRTSPEFKKYELLKYKNKEILENITNLNSELLSKYTPLEHSLRKLLKDDQKTLESLKDQKFIAKNPEKLKQILKQLKENIDSKEIILKNPEKTNKQITALIEYSDVYKEKTKELSENLSSNQKTMKENKFEEKLEEVTKELKEIELKIIKTTGELDNTKKENIKEAVIIIEKNLKKLGHPIKIKNVTLD
ncbi:hypothetical protein HOD38_05320 [archaeon]|jgi:DNA repair exonuclease SbcCD ATPase subunit|nr:hypothetical protein [archaeon]MBT4397660.1 hypothetical protein [archaeon]MBT4441644.1 hypothetical protein [archaeon]